MHRKRHLPYKIKERPQGNIAFISSGPYNELVVNYPDPKEVGASRFTLSREIIPSVLFLSLRALLFVVPTVVVFLPCRKIIFAVANEISLTGLWTLHLIPSKNFGIISLSSTNLMFCGTRKDCLPCLFLNLGNLARFSKKLP